VIVELDEVLTRYLGNYPSDRRRHDFPLRSGRFSLGTSLSGGIGTKGCRDRGSLIRFTDGRRLMYFSIQIGPPLERMTRRSVEAVLNSLRVSGAVP
jgi:hypothetical protein